jgi:peptidoglycan/LPS O-acetylase OafA/YrhL
MASEISAVEKISLSYPATISALTSLRFFGALAVFIYHIHVVIDLPHNYATALLYKGYLGVDFFFILSGFILTHVYYPQMATREFSARYFFANRIARIYPLHVTGIAIAFLMGCLWHMKGWTTDISFTALIKNLLLVQAWGINRTFSFNQPAWSISAEWFAYLVFPFLLAIFIRPRPAITLFFSIWLYGAIWAISVMLFRQPFTELSSSFSPLRIMPEFCLGMGLYLFGRVRPYPFYGTAFISLFVIALVLAIYLALPDPVSVILLGILIVTVAEGERRGIANFLRRAPLVYLGEISYAIYMVHFFVLFGVWSFRATSAFYPLLTLSLPATIGIAAVMHHVIELPCRTLLRNALK